MQGEQQMVERLPPGFRFFPTDEELITCYLARKAMDASFTSVAIRDVDLYKSEPWDLGSFAAGGGRYQLECCYFFCTRGSKYPSGVRARRALPFRHGIEAVQVGGKGRAAGTGRNEQVSGSRKD